MVTRLASISSKSISSIVYNIDITLIKEITNADGTTVNNEEIKEYINQKLGIKDEEKEDFTKPRVVQRYSQYTENNTDIQPRR